MDDNTVQMVPDYLAWVGHMHYATVDHFIQEAKEFGVCKRIGRVPRNLVLGQSRIFLAHDEGVTGYGFVFGYFIPNRLEILEPDPRMVLPYYLEGKAQLITSWDDDRDPGMYYIGSNEWDALVIFDRFRALDTFDRGRKHFRNLLQITYGERILRAKVGQFRDAPSRSARKLIARGEPWTVEEDQALLNYMKDALVPGRSKFSIFVGWEYKSGRRRSASMRRYYQLLQEGKVDTAN